MEGKELYSNEDEELDPKKKKGKEEEENTSDFGLPEIEDTDDSSQELADPFTETWEENKEEETFSYTDTFEQQEGTIEEESTPIEDFSSTVESEEEAENPFMVEDTDSDQGSDFTSTYYEEEEDKKKSPVGWIIAAVVVVIAIIIGIFWWINRGPEEPAVVSTPPVQEQVQEPEPEPEPVQETIQEPVPEPEPIRDAGLFEINEPTGRYYVIVASSLDKDLVSDYGKKLAEQGMTCNILAPIGNRMFHRLSIADFASLNDAAIQSEQLKGEFGEEVWVIRY